MSAPKFRIYRSHPTPPAPSDRTEVSRLPAREDSGPLVSPAEVLCLNLSPRGKQKRRLNVRGQACLARRSQVPLSWRLFAKKPLSQFSSPAQAPPLVPDLRLIRRC